MFEWLRNLPPRWPHDFKDQWDVLLSLVGLAAGTFGFLIAICQWRRDQAWKRGEQLDKLIEAFESDPLLRVARYLLDWEVREVEHAGSAVKLTNQDALLALRLDEGPNAADDFPGAQPLMRDALDALLSFFQRLEVACRSDAIDAASARFYLGYWVERLVTYDKHPVRNGEVSPNAQLNPDKKARLGEADRARWVARYVGLYGEPELLLALAQRFGIGRSRLSALRAEVRAARRSPLQ